MATTKTMIALAKNEATMTADWEGLKALEAKAIKGPVFVAEDDAEDVPNHKQSGLAMLETGRQSDWHYGRLMEWHEARFVAMLINQYPVILAAHEADQRVIAAAEKIINAVRGLAFGTDWNKGTHAEIYRPKLLAELAEFDKAKQ